MNHNRATIVHIIKNRATIIECVNLTNHRSTIVEYIHVTLNRTTIVEYIQRITIVRRLPSMFI